MPLDVDTEEDNTDNEEGVDETNVKPGPGKISHKLASFWLAQVKNYEADRSEWVSRGEMVLRRFRDDRNRAENDARRMNVLWANTKIMMPALYSKKPIAVIDRKFLDKDPVGRLSCQIAERATRNELDSNGLHLAVKAAVLDHLLPGQGQVWVRYEGQTQESVSIPAGMQTSMEDDLAKIEGHETEQENEKEEKIESTGEQLITESAPVDYINWKDFGMLPSKARTWSEVQAVFKRVLISKSEARQRFGKDIADDMVASTTPVSETANRIGKLGTSAFEDLNDRSIVVYEIWNKSDLKVYWVSTGYMYLCDIVDDPLELENFFPCPMPLWSTTTNDSLIPVPDYCEWQDQAIQIDELTMRIALLTKACKVAGTYDASNNALKRVLQESADNQLIPVDQWAVHAEKGGVQGSISFLPLKEIQSVLQTLIKVRQVSMQDLDLITGINDIMRGTTDSRETLGGIRLKNNNTGTRLSERQEEVARFARDTVKIVSEIICKHFSDEKLIEISGIKYEDELSKDTVVRDIKTKLAQNPQVVQQLQSQMQAQGMQPQHADQIIEQQAEKMISDKISASIQLLRNDIPRKYRIDIETDSTIYADASQERENATEFITVFTKFLQTAEGLTANLPEAMPLMGKMLQFGVRKFRTGRDLEAAIDTFVEQMTKKSQQMLENPPPKPDDAKLESEKIKQQGELAKIQATAKAQEQNDQRSAQIHQQEAAQDQQKEQQELQARMVEANFQRQLAEREFNMKMAELDRKEQLEKAKFEREMTKARQTESKNDAV